MVSLEFFLTSTLDILPVCLSPQISTLFRQILGLASNDPLLRTREAVRLSISNTPLKSSVLLLRKT